ncbi:hypothetical protein C6P42_001855 [Pichia californica]|nr:hypothetical protein C6P42_001855 [[Candida] californica]
MPVKQTEVIALDTVNDDKLIEYALSSPEFIDQFVPIIKSELLNKNTLNDLVDKLEQISTQKENDLQEISFHSIDDITNSVKLIEKIVNTSDTISKQILIINKNLTKSGKKLLEERKKVLNLKQSKQRIEDNNNKINQCLEILNLTVKILEMIKSGDFYRSLILLHSLSNNYLKDNDSFDFINNFFDAVPAFKMTIIEETFNQLNKWLNLSIEKNLSELGEVLFDNFNAINDQWFIQQSENLQLISFKVNSPVELSFRLNKYQSFDPLKTVNINLQPLFHSILVFEELDQLDKLKEYISNDIVRRIDHLFIPIKDSINKMNVFSSNESLRINLFSICSFSIVDKIITEKTKFRLRTINEVNSTFNLILGKIYPIISDHIDYHSNDLNDLIELNDIIGLFYQILRNYNFNCDSIYKLLLKIFKSFCKRLIENFKKNYNDISINDNSQQLIINSLKDFNKIHNDVFYIFHIENPKFPMNIPFSSIYIETCKLLKDFINEIYTFISKYYNNDNNVIILTISKSIDDILINIILKDLDDKIHSTYKEVVSQNLINLDFYSSSIYEIEKFLNYSNDEMIMRSRNFSNLIKLNSIDEFKKTRKMAIESMFNMMDIKVHSLFDMVDFNWNSDEIKSDPNTSLIDLIEFFQDSFKLNFSHLPESIKSLLLLKTLDKISNFLKDSIMESESLTEYSVKNFGVDIKYVEDSIPNFFDSNNISTRTLEPLKDMFRKLKQIIDLLSEGNLDNYKDSKQRLHKFNNISAEEAVKLINKLKSKDDDQVGENDSIYNVSSIMDTSQDDNRSIFGLKRTGTLFKK